jgi:hypothetical protein
MIFAVTQKRKFYAAEPGDPLGQGFVYSGVNVSGVFSSPDVDPLRSGFRFSCAIGILCIEASRHGTEAVPDLSRFGCGSEFHNCLLLAPKHLYLVYVPAKSWESSALGPGTNWPRFVQHGEVEERRG